MKSMWNLFLYTGKKFPELFPCHRWAQLLILSEIGDHPDSYCTSLCLRVWLEWYQNIRICCQHIHIIIKLVEGWWRGAVLSCNCIETWILDGDSFDDDPENTEWYSFMACCECQYWVSCKKMNAVYCPVHLFVRGAQQSHNAQVK